MNNSIRSSGAKPYQCAVGLILFAIIGSSHVAQEPPKVKQEPVLREVHLIITDKEGRSLDDIKQDEIQITEDGKPQTIESFSMLDLPVHLGLVIDMSGSLRLQFPKVIELARGIVESKKPDDQIFIVRFIDSARIDKLQERTSDKSLLLTAIAKLQPAGQGQTALIDAVYLAAQELSKPTGGPGATQRSAIVLISDGEDRQSFYSEEQLFKLLLKGNARIFIIGLVKELDREGGLIRLAARDRAIRLIERLARETGGRAFFPERPDDFSNALIQIAHDLHRQYVIRYHSAGGAKTKNPKIEIKVSDGPEKRKRKAIYKTRYVENEHLPGQ